MFIKTDKRRPIKVEKW